jgi:hypothetical protein
MNERFGKLVSGKLAVIAGVALALAASSAHGQGRDYDDAPEYQRAPTQSGNWRYEGSRGGEQRAAQFDDDRRDEPRRDDPRRYETVNRARPAYQQPPRRMPPTERPLRGGDDRRADYDRAPRLPDRYAARPEPPRTGYRMPRDGRPPMNDRDRSYDRGGDEHADHDHANHDHADHAQRGPRRNDDRVQQVGYQWRASRDEAQRAKLSEAPPYRPGADSGPNLGVLPQRDLLDDAPRMASRPRVRTTSTMNRENANREYELPPGNAPQPQAEYVPGPGGNTTYYQNGAPAGTYPPQGGGNFAPGTYSDDGFVPGGPDGFGPEGYGDGYDDGYGGGDWYDDGGPVTYDEFGRPLYLTPCPYCGQCCGGISCHHRWLDESSVFAGVHAFKGGLDQGQNGNFGFQEGVNFAGALWHRYGIGYQVGAQFVQSDLSGTNIQNAFNNSRQQTFLTVGLYHRPQCGQGWQGGAVYDWLDDRFYTRARFEQIRPEISYIFAGGNEFGYWGSFGTGSNQTQTVNGVLLSFNSVNMNAFFYRKNFANGDQFRIWGGFTDNSGGLLGADHRIHMSNNWDLMGGFNYQIPDQGKDGGGPTQESWGIALNLVWYPTRPTCGTHNGPFRSLFSVADNNWLMIRQK